MIKYTITIIFILMCLIAESIFVYDHVMDHHYVTHKAIPDTVIVPEIIERKFIDTIVRIDTIQVFAQPDFDSALEVLE